ncbi:MAG: hypothetical protein ACOX1F_00690 [Erysipelotrichaceae bacterium]|jgi:hypothetical protein
MALKFKKERDIVAKEIVNEDTKTYSGVLDETTREIDGVREKFGVQIYSEETKDEILLAAEKTEESERPEETVEIEKYYDDDDEYEYVTPSYFKNAFVLALVCVVIGAVISFFVFKTRMAADIRAAYEQNGYMLTNGCNANAEDIKEGKTAYIRGQLVVGTMKDIDTSNATATAADILKGYTAYVGGELITGTIPTYNGLTTIVPSTSDYKIPKGVYLVDDIVVRGDSLLASENIVKGVTIFGVSGSYHVTQEPGDE